MNMIKTKQALVIFTILALTQVNVAWAKNDTVSSKEPIVIKLTLKRIVKDAKGSEVQEDAVKIKPGDLLEYKAVYRNQSKQTVQGVTAVLPVPVGLSYVKQSALPAGAQASAEGAAYASEPLVRTEKDATGKEQTVAVPYSEYRSLRWLVGDMQAGRRVEVSARMQAAELLETPEALVSKPVTPLNK